ncbi:hypothetical protein BLX24_03200 [Arsenicibacter rosenii]|uniref:Toxin-antitoxin system YwqK family antitoxin n=2 Tax=Arsenicibacter rosenii TaxID=1750698 RepID=A0A1S2VT52_9BACT|nr:hypothetical protein BLX24_03200 [Arsenicibacter rosenii]
MDIQTPGLESVHQTYTYQGVPFTGIVVSRFPSGAIQSKAAYAVGEPDGISQQWYENGRTAEIRYYHKGRKTGHHLAWWPNGKRRFDYTFERDIPVGHHQNWYPTGRRFSSFHYDAEGHEAGLQQMWFESGQVKANYEMRNGRRYGLLGAKGCMGENTTNGLKNG